MDHRGENSSRASRPPRNCRRASISLPPIIGGTASPSHDIHTTCKPSNRDPEHPSAVIRRLEQSLLEQPHIREIPRGPVRNRASARAQQRAHKRVMPDLPVVLRGFQGRGRR
ncbi:unnamed protein product [Mycena citricolor]|uniref:Uncharacterized protein n=1 Tax=Mycena citricolor TaxID=2018698 RepID=A0AAD2HTS9_9AGAR|nr:unnamed protein product [Mycena citricolor]CAK5281296.1 unnamed protein product [Mycena citricolor]